MSDYAIEVEGLKKFYGSLEVVKGISFNISKGEIFGFLGPNGAGKTTTIKMMIGELPIDAGSVSILGQRVCGDLTKLHSLISVVPDFQNLYDRLTIRQNLEFFAELNNVSPSRVDEVLEEVFLTQHSHKACKNLSRGLRQRTLIGRGLLHKPSVFFLDEPTSALDPNSARLVRKLIKKLKNDGTTVFLTTHYMDEAERLCDRLAIMNLGKIKVCGKPSELKRQYGKAGILVEYVEGAGTKSKEFCLSDEKNKNEMCEFVKTHKILKLQAQEAGLEDVFMRVTGAKWSFGAEEV